MTGARGALGMVISIAVGTAMLAAATGGFQVFTTDAARVADVAARPRRIHPVALLDAQRAPVALSAADRSTIVTFNYTRCPVMCGVIGAAFQQLQSEVRRRGLTPQVRLLTVSFDPAWDTPERLGAYAKLMHPEPSVWTMATVARADDLPMMLRNFGVRVLADGAGGFDHNAAFYVIDTRGDLVAIIPLGDGLDTELTDAKGEALARAVAEVSTTRGNRRLSSVSPLYAPDLTSRRR